MYARGAWDDAALVLSAVLLLVAVVMLIGAVVQ